MNDHFLPYSLPDLGEDEIAEVVDSLRSGWVTTGPKAKRFEQDFGAYLGGDVEAVAVNSATAGLHLALEAIGVGPGDEVIVPSYTFTATAEVVRYLGAQPVIVDVLSDTFNIDPDAVERAVTSYTKAIIPVHFAGLSCDMSAIMGIAEKHGLKVIEDAAHALPSTWGGEKIGSLTTDATVFSFYANKTMTTGEGGMVVTRNRDIAERCRVMRLHGISRDAFDRYTSSTPSWHYEVVAPGYKYNMTDIAASIGIHQLRRIDGFQTKREQIALRYNDSLQGLPITVPPCAPEGELHARHLYPILVDIDACMGRDEFIRKMSERGIGCSVHFIPLHLHPYWKESCRLESGMFPVAQSIYEKEVTLPLYTRMSDDDVTRVIDATHSLLST